VGIRGKRGESDRSERRDEYVSTLQVQCELCMISRFIIEPEGRRSTKQGKGTGSRTHIRRFPPGCRVVTLTNLKHTDKPTGQRGMRSERAHRLLYSILFFARPLGIFFFSWASTFGV